jgi:hypothetical protein
MNNSKRITTFIASLLLTGLSVGVHANTLTFVLDQSNALPDGVDYLTVTLSDDVEGQLDFWVDTLSPLSGIAGENFGIQKFSFNLSPDLYSVGPEEGEGHHEEAAAPGRSGEHRNDEAHRAEQSLDREHGQGKVSPLDAILSAEDFILPDGWDVRFGKFGAGGGDFDIRLLGNGNNRQDPLHFSILGLDLDDVLAGFSAHVAGFDYIIGECGGEHGEGDGEGCRHISSAYFYGDRPVVVPLPASLWLLGSGLLALAGVSRHRKRRT